MHKIACVTECADGLRGCEVPDTQVFAGPLCMKNTRPVIRGLFECRVQVHIFISYYYTKNLRTNPPRTQDKLHLKAGCLLAYIFQSPDTQSF